MKLEALQPDAAVRGILPDAVVTVVSAEWHGSDALTLVYRGPNGRVADEILYRHDGAAPRDRRSGSAMELRERSRHRPARTLLPPAEVLADDTHRALQRASRPDSASTMTNYSDEQLERMLTAHGRAGVVFVGARDDGSAAGLTVTDELLRNLADVKTDGNTVPPPSLTVSKRVLRGAEMAVLIVEPSDSPPVRYRGRVHIRIGPRRGIATAQDERILNEKRRHRDRPFDVQPVASAALGDLNRRFFESEYLPAAVAPDILGQNDRTYEQRLAVTKMIVTAEEPIPTTLGILVLGISPRDFVPGAYIQFLRIAGRELADPVTDEQVIDGLVSDVLRRIDEKLVAHNRTAVEFTSGSVESRRQAYPLAALQQLVRNAVMHRSYEATNAPVRVSWFDDRIEILSPGGPYGAVTPENFGQPGLADYRNPNLAEALRVLGFVQRYGVGIPTARRELERNGNPAPEFTVEPTYVSAIVRSAA